MVGANVPDDVGVAVGERRVWRRWKLREGVARLSVVGNDGLKLLNVDVVELE